jgi:hypothetical protein
MLATGLLAGLCLLCVCLLHETSAAAAAGAAAAAVPTKRRRSSVSLTVSIDVRMYGIAQKDVPYDRLESFLNTMLPVSDVTGRHKQKLDVKMRFKYLVSAATPYELSQYENFLKRQPMNDANVYTVQLAALDEYLSAQAGLPPPSLQSFTIVLVHSDSLPRHVLYGGQDPGRCSQSLASGVAFLDLSASACDFALPSGQDNPSGNVQYSTPIFHHPWPGTFAQDKETLWNPAPASDIRNHRIARVGGVVMSAARTFGATNYLNIPVDSSHPFLIPIICFQNGVQSENVHFSVNKIQGLLDELLPIGHGGRVLAVTYGAEDMPEVAIAVAGSRRYHTLLVPDRGEETITEYSSFDGDAVWSRLRGTIDAIVARMVHTLRHAEDGPGAASVHEAVSTYPIVVFSDFHDIASNIAPLFSNGRTSQSVGDEVALLALHYSPDKLSQMVRGTAAANPTAGEWTLVHGTDPSKLVVPLIAKMVSGLTDLELQSYDAFNSADATWMRDDEKLVDIFMARSDELPAGSFSSVHAWAARRGVAMSSLNKQLVATNNFIETNSLVINQLKNLERLSKSFSGEGSLSVSQILGDELRGHIFPGLDSSSSLFPLFGKVILPVEVDMLLDSMEESLRQLDDVVVGLVRNLEHDQSVAITLPDIFLHVNSLEHKFGVINDKVDGEMRILVSILRSCTVSYESPSSENDRDSSGRKDNSTMIVGGALGALLLLVLIALGLYKFQKFIESKAKKLA